MLLEEIKRRQGQLEDIIRNLSETYFENNDLRRYIFNLKDLYHPDFRHYYSGFFPLISDIAKDNKKYSLECLLYNIDIIKQLVEQDFIKPEEQREFGNLYKPIIKLSDHLNLEIARYNCFFNSEQKLLDIEKRILDSEKQLSNATNQLKNAQHKINSVQTELIAVLSIFSAIVMTFAGGLNLLGGTLSSMQETPIHKMIFFILLCGFIIINFVFAMMYFVSKITGRNIYAHCRTDNCTCSSDNSPICNCLKRFWKRLPYIFWLNVSILIILLVDIIYIFCK